MFKLLLKYKWIIQVPNEFRKRCVERGLDVQQLGDYHALTEPEIEPQP